MSASNDQTADPMPQAPVAPGPAECCESGCDPCVFDRYAEAVVRYENLLAAWQARQRQICDQ